MHKSLLPLAIAAVALISGCATSGPTYQYVKDRESAILVGRNVVIFTGHDDVHVTFLEIDDLGVEPSFWTGLKSEIPVSPGDHRIVVYLSGYGFVVGLRTVELGCEARHLYRFSARKEGVEFDLTIWDETGGESNRKLVSSHRIVGKQGSTPVTVPLFLPAK